MTELLKKDYCIPLTDAQKQVIEFLKDDTFEYGMITIKKGKHGKIKRITVHIEQDVYIEDK